jgi:hypothetical protein
VRRASKWRGRTSGGHIVSCAIYLTDRHPAVRRLAVGATNGRPGEDNDQDQQGCACEHPGQFIISGRSGATRATGRGAAVVAEAGARGER